MYHLTLLYICIVSGNSVLYFFKTKKYLTKTRKNVHESTRVLTYPFDVPYMYKHKLIDNCH